MTPSVDAALEYLAEHHDRFMSEWVEFISIPSISTDSAYRSDMRRAAEWSADRLRKLGAQNVGLYPTPETHPVVYGEILDAGPGAPTVLVYGHYDVQPPDPLDEWISPPFEAELRGDWLYARGASDMKGQIIASIAAIEAVRKTSGLPVNIKFMFEGEEETGSAHMEAFIVQNRDMLASDVSLNPDAGMLGPDAPALTYALRGLSYFEIRFDGPNRDLHSGLFGGVVHNPALALCQAIAGMLDERCRVTLPGFYDRVRRLSEEERAELARLPRDEAFFLAQSGVPELWGDPDYTPFERVGARPSLDVNGFYSGFVGEGQKTVLPAYAVAKISTRLVPDQDPKDIYDSLKRYLQETVPGSIRWQVKMLSSNPASISDRSSRAGEAMSRSLEEVWGRRPMFNRVGGSIPVVGMIQEHLGIESVLTGFALPDDNVHSPNERQHLPTWVRGTQALVRFLYHYGS